MVTKADSRVGLAAYSGLGFVFSAHFSKYRFLVLNCFQMRCSTGKILGPSGFFFEYTCQFSELLLHLDYNQVKLVGKSTVF